MLNIRHGLYVIEIILNMAEKMKTNAGYRVNVTNLREKDFLIFLYREVSGKNLISGIRQVFLRLNLVETLNILTMPDIIKTGALFTVEGKKTKNATSVPTTKRNQVFTALLP